ncbi:MAG: Holliday junction resolvase RecU [Firmicutes bacterium]|nr:Holliday junction resolvase RecU [Bacillota bacterium]
MAYWSGRGLRGSAFEEMINITNKLYSDKNLAVVQKIPTPITPLKMDKSRGLITSAYFEKKSTVDYMGAAQGIPICFDAKETEQGRLPLQNIHEHQVDFMRAFKMQGGVSFLLVHCKDKNEIYFVSVEVMYYYWRLSRQGGRKSIPYDAFEEKYRVRSDEGFPVHYLEAVNTYIMSNDEA